MKNKNYSNEDEGQLDQLGQSDIDQLSRPGLEEENEQKEPQPVEGHTQGYLIGPPVGARFPRKEWQALLQLKRLYGFDSFPDTLRMAVLDALAYQEGEQNEGSSGELAERLDRLSAKVDALNMSPTAETQEPEKEEEASPYDPEVIDFFKNLDSKGKKYLIEQLKGSPTARSLGSMPAWKREIRDYVQTAAPHDGYRRHAPATHQARRDLYDFLVQEKILS